MKCKYKSRYDPIEVPTTCFIRILRGDTWYEMSPLMSSISRSREIISRLRRKGRTVNARWLSGMGLGL